MGGEIFPSFLKLQLLDDFTALIIWVIPRCCFPSLNSVSLKNTFSRDSILWLQFWILNQLKVRQRKLHKFFWLILTYFETKNRNQRNLWSWGLIVSKAMLIQCSGRWRYETVHVFEVKSQLVLSRRRSVKIFDSKTSREADEILPTKSFFIKNQQIFIVIALRCTQNRLLEAFKWFHPAHKTWLKALPPLNLPERLFKSSKACTKKRSVDSTDCITFPGEILFVENAIIR
jgi:hypothetical protein